MIKLRILDLYEKFAFQYLGPTYRILGKRLFKQGLSLQGNHTSDERLVPSLRNRAFKEFSPQTQKTDFIAPNATLVGQVNMGQGSSVWYGATLRGDLNKIEVGKNSLLQDLVTVFPKSGATSIGDNVLVGPNVFLEGCQLENNSFIGMGSSIGSGSKIQSKAIVAAGAIIPENTTVPTNQVWAGNPATYLRDLTPEERDVLDEHQQEMLQLARVHSEETEKSFRQILNDEDLVEEEDYYDPQEMALKHMKELGFPMEFDDEDYIEHRVFLKTEGGVPDKESNTWKKNYDPFEQDLYNYPDNFKIYQENYDKHEEIKKYFEENPNQEAQLGVDRSRVTSSESSWDKKFD